MTVDEVSDRTFLMHLGGKIEVQSVFNREVTPRVAAAGAAAAHASGIARREPAAGQRRRTHLPLNRRVHARGPARKVQAGPERAGADL